MCKDEVIELRCLAEKMNTFFKKFGCKSDKTLFKEKFHHGFQEYEKINTDPPKTPCVSCMRLLCYRRFNFMENFSINVTAKWLNINL